MLETVEGSDTNGEIEQSEIPEEPAVIRFGQFRGRLEVDEEDFKAAEWRWIRDRRVSQGGC